MYKNSDEWDTSRKFTKLGTIQSSVISNIIGFQIRFGDIEFIKKFKLRQKNPEVDFKIEIAPGKKSLKELERELVGVWHYQLKSCYNLNLKEDDKAIEAILKLREIIQKKRLE